MSDIDISRLSANNLVTLDSTGTLASTPVEGVSSSFLALSDDGYYGGEQVLELSMFGLTPEQMNHGRLYASVSLGNGTFTISHRPEGDPNPEIICQNDIGSAGDVYDIDLAPYGTAYAGLKGTVKLAVGSEDLEIQLLVPQSTSEAIIVGSTSWFLSGLELDGVTKSNSDNGVLAWSLTAAAGSYTFTLTNPGVGTVATASGSIYEYAPLVCDLVPYDGSGITGTVVLEGFGNSSGLAIVKVIETLRLPSLSGEGTRALAVDRFGRLVIAP
jgi:hypothetical protein